MYKRNVVQDPGLNRLATMRKEVLTEPPPPTPNPHPQPPTPPQKSGTGVRAPSGTRYLQGICVVRCRVLPTILMPPADLGEWTPSDVTAWCAAALARRFPETPFGEMLANLEKVHLIDGLLLVQLDDSDWREAVPSIGARKTLMNEVRCLVSRQKPRPPRVVLPEVPTVVSEFVDSPAPLRSSLRLARSDLDRPSGSGSTFGCSPRAKTDSFGGARVMLALSDRGRGSDEPPTESCGSPASSAARQPRRARPTLGLTDSAAHYIVSRMASSPHKQSPSSGAGRAKAIAWGAERVYGYSSAEASLSSVIPEIPAVEETRSAATGSSPYAASRAPRAPPEQQAIREVDHAELTVTFDEPPRHDSVPSAGDALADGPPQTSDSSSGLHPSASFGLGGGAASASCLEAPSPDPATTELIPGRSHPSIDRKGIVNFDLGSLLPSEPGSPSRVIDVLQTKQNLYGMAQSQLLRTSTFSSRPSGIELPKGSGWFDLFLESSKFSNLPIVECQGTLHNLSADQPMRWCQRLNRDFAYAICKIVVLFQTIGRTLEVWQVAWCLLGCLCTWLFRHWQMTADIPVMIHTSLLIFPLAFSVNAGYQRREGALSYSAQFKASCLTLYLHHRCFQFEEQVPHDFILCSCGAFTSLFEAVRMYLTASTEESKVYDLQCVYDIFSEISLVNDVLRISGLPAPMVAALSTNMREIIVAFESLRTFCDYRTPSSVRCFVWLGVVLSPVLLIPSWAALALTTSPHSEWMVYVGAFLTPLWLMFLLNTQTGLENPFSGVDGIRLDALQMVEYMADTELMQTTNDGNAFGSSSSSSSSSSEEFGGIGRRGAVTSMAMDMH